MEFMIGLMYVIPIGVHIYLLFKYPEKTDQLNQAGLACAACIAKPKQTYSYQYQWKHAPTTSLIAAGPRGFVSTTTNYELQQQLVYDKDK